MSSFLHIPETFWKTISELVYNSLIKSTTGSFLLKITSTLMNFLISVLLARHLGAEQYGLYVYVITTIIFLSVFSTLGFPPLLVRKTAEYNSTQSFGYLKGLIKTSDAAALFASVLIISVSFIAIHYFLPLSSVEQEIYFQALILLPILTLSTFKQATIRGLKYVVRSQLPELLLKPMLFLLIIYILYLFQSNLLTLQMIIWLNITVSCIALATGVYILNTLYPSGFKGSRAETSVPAWAKAAFPLLLINLFQLTNFKIDILILGYFKGTAETAYYSVASSGASLILFLLISMEMTIAPYIATYYSNNELGKLQRLLTMSSRLCLSFTVVISVLMMLLSNVYLNLFGTEYINGKLPLIILCVGAIVNAFFGASGQLALMTGNERLTSNIVGLTAILNVILNVTLIPKMGSTGAAIANITCVFVWNLAITICLYRKIGLAALPFSLKAKIGTT